MMIIFDQNLIKTKTWHSLSFKTWLLHAFALSKAAQIPGTTLRHAATGRLEVLVAALLMFQHLILATISPVDPLILERMVAKEQDAQSKHHWPPIFH